MSEKFTQNRAESGAPEGGTHLQPQHGRNVAAVSHEEAGLVAAAGNHERRAIHEGHFQRAARRLIPPLLAMMASDLPLEQKVREQQYAQPGQALLEIIDDSVLELEFIVPSRWLAWLKPGHAFKVSIDEVGRSFPAKVYPSW